MVSQKQRESRRLATLARRDREASEAEVAAKKAVQDELPSTKEEFLAATEHYSPRLPWDATRQLHKGVCHTTQPGRWKATGVRAGSRT